MEKKVGKRKSWELSATLHHVAAVSAARHLLHSGGKESSVFSPGLQPHAHLTVPTIPVGLTHRSSLSEPRIPPAPTILPRDGVRPKESQ